MREGNLGKQHFQHAACAVGLVVLIRGALHDQHEFAARAIRVRGEPLPRLSERARMHRFKELGEFACDHDAPRRPQELAQIGERRVDAMRRLVEHQRPADRAQRLDHAPPLARALRQKSLEQEPRIGETGGGQRRREGACPRDRNDAMTRRARSRHQLRPRIGYRRRARIAHQRHGFSLREQTQQARNDALLVMRVQRSERRRDLVMAKQSRRHPRILSRHQRDAPQHVECAQRDVAQIPNRGGNYI